MIIDCISDLHGFLPKLEGGDLLIVAGDCAGDDHEKFLDWICVQPYTKCVFIAGNHDNWCVEHGESLKYPGVDVEYLCDSGTTFQNLKIWGTPCSLWFDGVNPHCTAFMSSERGLKDKFDKIPSDIDILITHTPPYGILDRTFSQENAGSYSLYNLLDEGSICPLLHVFGHIHESYGHYLPIMLAMPRTQFVNASHINRNYEPVNPPIRIVL